MLPWHNVNFFHATTRTTKPNVAISACLNGHAGRYDGRDSMLETTSTLLSNYLTLLPICPEVGAGQSVPRPPVQLIQSDQGLEAYLATNNTGSYWSLLLKVLLKVLLKTFAPSGLV